MAIRVLDRFKRSLPAELAESCHNIMLLNPPDVELISKWLQLRFPERRGLEIVAMKRAFPGLSRETWFLDTRWRADGDECRERFVLRTQLPGNLSLSLDSLHREALLFEALENTDVPVAKFYGYEDDEAWLIDGERPFFLRGWTPGALEPAHINDPNPRYDAVRVATAKELISQLVKVHRIDWKALGLDESMQVPPTPEQAPAFVLDQAINDYDNNHHEPFPAFIESLMSLRDDLPPGPSQLVLAKGNCGLGDEVWAEQGVSITAMCDWETSRIGDPAIDIAATMRSTGWCWNLEAILDWYEELTGERISAERVRFYSIINRAQSLAVLHGRAIPFVTSGRDRRLQLLSVGLLPHLAESAIAEAIGF